MRDSIPTGQAEGLQRLLQTATSKGQREGGAKILAVASGKGGVGKTNLAVNLGLSLVRRGKRVVILDADMGLANVDIVLNRIPRYNLTHVLSGQKSLMEALTEGPEGLMLLAGGTGLEDLANLSRWRLKRLVDSLQILDAEFDVIIIDSGAGIAHAVMTFVLAAQEILVVTTVDPTAITDAYGLIKVIANRNKAANIGLVVNMVSSKKQAQGVYDRISVTVNRFLGMEIKYRGAIPEDPMVRNAIRQQQPFLLRYPRCAASRAINDLAHRIVDEEQQQEGVGGMKLLLQRIVGLSIGRTR